MTSPKIRTYREIIPLVYSWSTPDIPKYEGWEKIGYTEQASADTRINQQASQLAVKKVKNWSRRAMFTSEAGGRFTDREFHQYLRQQGIARELQPRTEWHDFTAAARRSVDYFNDFAGQDFSAAQTGGTDEYVLRPEQQAAVQQALDAFASGQDEVLWNAKPRFGKTLATYDLMRELDALRVLVVTNRPAIATSWFDDFARFIGHQTSYKFVSESPSLEKRSPLTWKQWRKHTTSQGSVQARLVQFVSLQDLKGSRHFGGYYDKLQHIAELDWDLLVIDEAHEGVDTLKTDIAFDQISRTHTLHLSGTPFKALASGKFTEEQIFNWTYADERLAQQNWDDEAAENPYTPLPKLNMLTYQVSRMISDKLAVGVATQEDAENIDFAFNLGEFFSTKSKGRFTHEADVMRFLDTLTTNEKYPFSTPELRDEVRHSFWLLDRVASAKALEKILKKHPVFKDYTVVLAAGDGRSDDGDLEVVGKTLDRVHKAIADAEEVGGKTITLSVGQLTTGVTVPEWTAVIMLSNITSPALYMQAAFRAQNPCTFERGGRVLQKENAYIFDFAPERTLITFDKFANNLGPNPSGNPEVRRDNIRELLNFFPILGEDSEGRMVELDASQVLTFPQVFKAREVVRRGFLSNLLFDNVAGIFRYSEHLTKILEKLPEAKQGNVREGTAIDVPEPPPVTDADGNVVVPGTVINPKVEGIGKPVWAAEDLDELAPSKSRKVTARSIAKIATAKARPTREELRKEYGLTKTQVKADERRTENRIAADAERAIATHEIARSRLDAELADAATEAEAAEVKARQEAHEESFNAQILAVVAEHTEQIPREIVTREETRKAQTQADETMDKARAHLRGFARTIPMFLMAYGDRDTRLSNLDDYTPDDVFEEITGITEGEFRLLRDGQTIIEEDGTETWIPGLFDEAVFDQSIQEFFDKKEALANYFDEAQTENIFAYIPQQKTSLVFTPETVVKRMVDTLEEENPGIFSDPTKTFADLFSTAGLFLMELVRRLDRGLADVIRDPQERLRHILTKQIFEMSHNEILHEITLEAVSGGVPERREWMETSGHFRVGNLAKMTPEERQSIVSDMLSEGNAAVTKKFDVVIGNPPYQDEAKGEGTRDTPVYHLFIDAAHEVGEKAVLITPARFLFDAGFTPKAWNRKILADPHIKVPIYRPRSADLFPGTDIMGGIAVTLRDSTEAGEPIGTFTKFPELNAIQKKVGTHPEHSLATQITSSRSFRYLPRLYEDHPQLLSLRPKGNEYLVETTAFEQFKDVFQVDQPADGEDYRPVLGMIDRQRAYRWIRKEYFGGPSSLDKYKVALPKSNGSPDLGAIGLPLVLDPGVGATYTFITVGSFEEEGEALACLAYVKTKFARALLGVLKVTQHNPASTWKHVPLQDFTADSDIDWSKPIPEIDQQLYKKYELSEEEIEFIESHVKPMD